MAFPKESRALLAATLLLTGILARAQDEQPKPQAAAAGQPGAKGQRKAKAAKAAKADPKSAAERAAAHEAMLARQLDLNAAPKEQLKTLPGVTDAIADQIIAGRPYLTKAHLVTRKVVSDALYGAIRNQIKVLPPKTLTPKAP